MKQRILRCPSCSKRFDYTIGSVTQETLICPKCGQNHAVHDYYALMACPHCNTNLEVPWELLEEDSLLCPQCNQEFCPKILTAVNHETFDSTADALCRLGSAPKQMLQENEYFDKYRIIRMLGKGGMSEVYLAEHVILKQLCALKIMKQSIYNNDETNIKRFVREAKLSHSIDHPNIVKVYDVGNDTQKGFFFIAMEYISGKSLLAIMGDHLFSEKELYDVIFSMSKVLIELEKHKIVHRDIKPSNIMIDKDGVLKLMDLGIAKAETGVVGEMTLTMDKAAIGTPSYASPEQCQSAHTADQRSDIYCLGTTLYHLASGKLPFEGDTPMAILLKVVQANPVPLAKLRPDLSKKMISLIEKMMKKDPNQRPQSGAELLAQLMKKENFFLEKIHKTAKKKLLSICGIACAVLLVLIWILLQIFSYSGKSDKTKVKENPPITASSHEKEDEEEEEKNIPLPKAAPSSKPAASIPASKIPAVTVTSKKAVGPAVLQQPKPGKEGRTIAFRLKENYWMTQYLNLQPETTPWKIEKVLFLNIQRDLLEKIAVKRNTLKAKASAAVMDADLKKKLQEIIQQRALGQVCSPEILKKTGYKLYVGLKSAQINPNTLLSLDGQEYTLLELLIKGYLPFPKLLDTLLQAGADPDRIDTEYLPLINGKSPAEKRFMMFLHILQAGRNNIDTWNNTSIISSICTIQNNRQIVFSAKNQSYYNWELVKFILRYRGLMNFRDHKNRSLAHYAAAWNQDVVLEYLHLSGFKEINAPDKTGATPYQLALCNGATAAVEMFEKYNLQTACSEKDRNQGEMVKAITADDLKRIIVLENKGASLSYTYINHLTPLQLAISYNSNKAAVYLLSKDTNKNNFYICHNLFIAVYAGNVNMFKYLLKT